MIEQSFQDHIAAATGLTLYAIVMPEKHDLPAAVFQTLSTSPQYTCQGPSNYAVRIKLDLYANSYLSVKTLQELARNSLDGYSGLMGADRVDNVEIETELDDFETDSKLYRVTIIFNIFFRST